MNRGNTIYFSFRLRRSTSYDGRVFNVVLNNGWLVGRTSHEMNMLLAVLFTKVTFCGGVPGTEMKAYILNSSFNPVKLVNVFHLT